MPPIRLLVVVNVYAPDLGGGILFRDLFQGLADRGIDVTVRCAYPYYPEWQDKSGKNGLSIERYRDNSVAVERLGIFIPRDPNSLGQRMLYEASFFFSLLRTLPRTGRFDLVMAYCPLVGGVAFGGFASLLYRKPLWLNVQDLSASAAAAGGMTSGVVDRALNRVQSALFNRADVWSTISPIMQVQLEKIARHGQRVLVFPNWMHSSLKAAIARFPRDPLHRPGRPVKLLYSGNLGTKQNLRELCGTLHASDADFLFDIRAAGSTAPALREWLARIDDERFRMSGLSDEDDFAQALRDADLFVITEKTGAGGSFIPSKLVPAATAGTPVLAVSDRDSPLGTEVRKNGIGAHLGWTNLSGVVEIVSHLPANTDYAAWQEASRRRSAHYDRERVIDRYYEQIVAFCTSHRRDRQPTVRMRETRYR